MKIKPFILALCLTFPLLSNVANAMTSKQDRQAYKQMQILQTNLLSGNVMGIFEQYPPSYLQFIARDMGITSEEFLQRMQILSKIIPKDSDIAEITKRLKYAYPDLANIQFP